MIKPSKAVIAGAAVAGSWRGPWPFVPMPPALPRKRVLHSEPWQAMKRESIPVKGKTNVRAKADARVATTVARAKTLAKAKAVAPPTEASPKRANHEA
jgi:hypothetical protein